MKACLRFDRGQQEAHAHKRVGGDGRGRRSEIESELEGVEFSQIDKH